MIYHVVSRIHSAVVIAFSMLIFISCIYLFHWLGIEPQTTEAGFLVLSTIITVVAVSLATAIHISMREDVADNGNLLESILIDRMQKYLVELALSAAAFITLQLVLLSVYIMKLYNLPISTILYAVVAVAIIGFGIYHVRSIYKSVQQERIDKTMDALKENAY